MPRNLLKSVTVLAMFSLAVSAQTTATISGTVYDQGGGVVAGATIVITNLDTQQERDLKTDGSGRYYAPALSPGRYKASAASPGFEQVVQPDVTLTPYFQRRVSGPLVVGGGRDALGARLRRA